MALGKKRGPRQDELFIATAQIITGPGPPFYTRLNAVLAEAGFDEFVEKLCIPYYKKGGRPGIPPGVYFRMLLIGYFEGLDSQRGIHPVTLPQAQGPRANTHLVSGFGLANSEIKAFPFQVFADSLWLS